VATSGGDATPCAHLRHASRVLRPRTLSVYGTVIGDVTIDMAERSRRERSRMAVCPRQPARSL